MNNPTVSVVVVSRDRPKSLTLCLLGLSQLYYDNFEIIVVANEGSIEGVFESGLINRIKLVRFEEANISAARNAGIGQSAGEIVAFIDDDAVPEPLWLDHLIATFADESVSAAGGFVIGRNGISLQWKGRMVFSDGQAVDLPIEGMKPRVFDAEAGRAIKTEGTNMAVRRDVLIDVGGFDAAFRFYLDETDLNMRLTANGHRTAIVPLAQVHHGYAESDRRTSDRVPRDLTDIGRSSAIFVRKHRGNVKAAQVTLFDQQRTRLLRLMVSGHIAPGDVSKLTRTLKVGWAEGSSASFGQLASLHNDTAFRRIDSVFGRDDMTALCGRFWQRSATLGRAKSLLLRGNRVAVYLFSFSTIYHYVRFQLPGVWVQSGGQFGRSNRDAPVFKWWRAKMRLRQETRRSAEIRLKSCLSMSNTSL